jgi:N-acetylmuramoyl-L-alanine amidase
MSKLIALCDGHGMETSGKRTPIFPAGSGLKSETGNFMHENEFNRAVVKYLDAELKRCGFKTLLVAPTDYDTPLKARTDLANAKKADLYCSVHANAIYGKWGNARGIETFYYPGSATGKALADIVHKHLMKGTAQVNRGVKSGDLHVLRETHMPAVLVECGFMDNLDEAKLLLSDAFRKECAKEIAQAICEYFKVTYVPETTVSKSSVSTNTTKKDDGTMNLAQWQKDELEQLYTGAYKKGIFSSNDWATLAKKGQIKEEEVAFLNAVLINRILVNPKK